MKKKLRVFSLLRLIKMIDAGGIKKGSPAFDAMNGVALGEEEFGQVGSVLASNASDECGGHC
jgi:hypothetical protein